MRSKDKITIILSINLLLFLILGKMLFAFSSFSRLKDISRVKGVRDNQLLGYGLVVGLNGSGDKVAFTKQMVGNMLKRFGLKVPTAQINSKNVAAVVVTAKLPTFTKSGDRIDVTISSIGDAKSLEGGVLLQTPLQAANKKTYAVAQGSVSVGGRAGRGGAGGLKNHVTVARIPDGAIVEREVEFNFIKNGNIIISLNQKDFTTAARAAKAINLKFGMNWANPVDSGTIKIKIPESFKNNIISFISSLEEIQIAPDEKAVVVINEKTGTVVVGENVKISTVAVSHGNLNVEIDENGNLSPAALLNNKRIISNFKARKKNKTKTEQLMLINSGINVNDLVKSLNAMGVSAKDLISIFQAIKEANALHADLKII